MVLIGFLAFPSHLKWRRSPQERRQELQGRATNPRVPQMSQSIPGKLVFLALRRLSSQGSTHTSVARATSLWKAPWESHRSLDPSDGKRDIAATAQEQSARAFPHSRQGLTPLGRLQKYPKIHISTGEESLGSCSDSSQGIWPRHRRERNPEMPPSNSHGDCPFLRPPEWVLEVPVVSRKHLPHLEKSRRFSPPGEMRPISAQAS